MPSVTTDKFTDARDTTNPVVTTVSSPRSIGGSSLSAVSLSGWPTNTVHFITYRTKVVNGTTIKDTSTQCDWKAVKAGTTLGSLTLENSPGGTDPGNSVGDFIEMGPTAAWGNDLYQGLTKEHHPDGSHASVTADNLTVGTTLTLPAGAINYADLLSTIFSGQLQTQTNTGGGGGTMKYINLGGIRLLWGTMTNGVSGTGFQNSGALLVTFPVGFFTTIDFKNASASEFGATSALNGASWVSISTIGGSLLFQQYNGNGDTGTVNYLVIGT
jgi:hypothetical protein